MARSHDTSSVGTHLTSTPRPRTYNWASTRFEAKPGDKCQSHRQRWPQVEAVIQVILRILLICVHICPMYITLLARATFFNWPPITFVSICWSLTICLVELVSLTAPGGFCGLPRFPRLPSFYLSICELLAIACTLYNMYEVMRPNWRQRDRKGDLIENLDCPVSTCVTKDEYYGIVVFQCQLIALMFHFGFCIMAVKHFIGQSFDRCCGMDRKSRRERRKAGIGLV